jgi:hypothetical protein
MSRVAALRPDVVIDLICFTRASAQRARRASPVAPAAGALRDDLGPGPALWVPVTEDEPRTAYGEYGTGKAEIEALLHRPAAGPARSAPDLGTPRSPESTPSAALPPAPPAPGRSWATRPGTARSAPCARRWPGWWPTARPTWAISLSRGEAPRVRSASISNAASAAAAWRGPQPTARRRVFRSTRCPGSAAAAPAGAS